LLQVVTAVKETQPYVTGVGRRSPLSEINKAPLQANTELPFLTGMRGYAAVWVMAAHVIGAFLSGFPPLLDHVLNLGRNGIFVFFVLSAFTITLSLQRGFNPVEYALKRFLRIAPAYYVMLVVMLPLGGSYWAIHFNTPYDFTSFVYHISFLNWIDFRQANNALGVEWTLSIEMLYYLLLPAIIAISKSTSGGILLLVVGVAALFYPHAVEVSVAHKWAPWPYLICFVSGVLAYRLWTSVAYAKIFKSGFLIPVLVLALMLSPRPGNLEFDLLWWSFITCCFLFCGHSSAAKVFFENKAALFFGRISYSLYLVHLPIAGVVSKFVSGWFGVALTLIASIAAAIFLYRYVEVRGQMIGRSLLTSLPPRFRVRSNFTVHNHGTV